MKPEQWSEIEDLWERVLDRPINQRRAFLDQVCEDAELRGEVDSLLGYEADSFLETPLDLIAATLLPEWSLQPGDQLQAGRSSHRLRRGERTLSRQRAAHPFHASTRQERG